MFFWLFYMDLILCCTFVSMKFLLMCVIHTHDVHHNFLLIAWCGVVIIIQVCFSFSFVNLYFMWSFIFSFHLLDNMGFTYELNLVWYKKKKIIVDFTLVKLSCKGTQYFNSPLNPSNLFISFFLTISNKNFKTLSFSNYHLI